MDLSLETCLKSLGISLLTELDVLVFVHKSEERARDQCRPCRLEAPSNSD